MGLFKRKQASAPDSATPRKSILDAANEWLPNLPETLPDGSPWEQRNGILGLVALADDWIENGSPDERIKAVLQPMMSMRDIQTEDAMIALQVRFEGIQFVERLNGEGGQAAETAASILAYALDGMHRYRLAANPEYVKIIENARREVETEEKA